MMTIDTTNMCSYLQKKLFDKNGIYHHLWMPMQEDQELTAIVRSRQLHIYRNGKKVLILAGKSAPKIVREDKLCEMTGLAQMQNNSIRLIRLSDERTIAFKEEMQEAFQYGFKTYSKDEEKTNQWQVLPDKDFYHSLETEGAEAYEAINNNGQHLAGAIITANGNMGELAFLYVKVGVQSKGIGQSIWRAIEAMHPEIEVWETCTPYFDRRNIHFYINRRGFHVVEFFNEHHPDPNMPEQFDQEDGLFKFEKRMIQ